MNLSQYLRQGTIINKSAILLVDIELEEIGEYRKVGDTITIVMKNIDGTYHAEDNDWACKVTKEEFKYKGEK